MTEEEKIARIKKIIREDDCPVFTDDDIKFYLAENDGDSNATIRQLLLIKSEDTTLSVSGLSLADTSKYFRRLAQRYRKHHSGLMI